MWNETCSRIGVTSFHIFLKRSLCESGKSGFAPADYRLKKP